MSTTGLRFTETHEWIRVDGSVATIGITDLLRVSWEMLYTLIFPKSTMRSNKAKSSVR